MQKDILSQIRHVFDLDESLRMSLVDEDGDIIVISDCLPNNLLLEVQVEQKKRTLRSPSFKMPPLKQLTTKQ